MVSVNLRKPTDAQARFIYSDKKRIVIRAGRRGGKTTGVGIRAVERFLQGKRVLYAAPTNDQVDTFWAEVTTSLMEVLEANLLTKNETKHTLVWRKSPENAARIRAKTAWNANTLRGDYADELILDEWQLMDEDAWEVIGAPMLLDNNGDATFIYTPPSLHSKAVSKAQDVMHAAKMFKHAQLDSSGRWDAIHFTSFDNPHISREALDDLTYDMTPLAIRQEIMAQDIDVVPGALWTPQVIERNRVPLYEFDQESLSRICIAVDPAGSSTKGHEIGIMVAGSTGTDRHNRMGYLLADLSLHATPERWAAEVIGAYDIWDADSIVVEKNYGGEMVASTIRLSAAAMGRNPPPIVEVNATRGKQVRAEPIAGLHANGRIKYVGHFPELEEQLLSFLPGNADDRVDAKVWAFTHLLGDALPRINPVDDEQLFRYEQKLKVIQMHPAAALQFDTQFGGVWRKEF